MRRNFWNNPNTSRAEVENFGCPIGVRSNPKIPSDEKTIEFAMNCDLLSIPVNLLNSRFRRAVLLLFLLPCLLSAQVFEAKTEPREVALGSTLEVSFSLKDARGERFKAPDFKDFKVVAGPSEMRGMTIINGRTSSHQTWSYELEPRRAGTFSIGPATVTADGKTLSTKPLSVRVVPSKSRPGPGQAPGATDNLFITGEIDRKTAWLGQQVTWRIQLYTQLSLEGADIIEIPEFEGFYSREKRRFDTRLTYQTVRGKKYAVKTLYEEALFPQETGELTIGAAKVRVGIDQPGAFGVFLGAKPVVLQTQPVRLTVKPLPAPTPEHFTGGVGQYDWEVEVDRDSLSTDDALTLKISLRGNGDSKRFAAPKFDIPPGLDGIEPKIAEEEEYENGEEVIHSRVFEYVLLPKQPGEYQIRPALTFFNPDSNRYYTLSADSLPLIRVTAGANYQNDQVAVDTVPLPAPPQPVEFKLVDHVPQWLHSPFALALPIFGLALFGIFYLLRKKKPSPAAAAPERNDAPALPSPKAMRERFAKAAAYLNSDNPRAFYDELFKSLQGYLAARFQLSPAQMTQENVRRILSERNVHPATIQNLLSVWQTCEQALFAGQAQSAQMDPTWRQAESVVQDLEKTLRKG